MPHPSRLALPIVVVDEVPHALSDPRHAAAALRWRAPSCAPPRGVLVDLPHEHEERDDARGTVRGRLVDEAATHLAVESPQAPA